MVSVALVIPLAWSLVNAIGADRGGPARSAATVPESARTARCDQIAEGVAHAVQTYTDRFAGVTGFESPPHQPLPDAGDVRAEFVQVRDEVRKQDCADKPFRAKVGNALDSTTGDGPLAGALDTMLVTNLLDVLAGNTVGKERTIAEGADLAATIADLPNGSTLRLGAGKYELAAPAYVLADLTVIGAGEDRTTIESTAPGAAVLVPGGAALSLSGLTLRHTGGGSASVLAVWAGTTTLSRVTLTGATVAASGPETAGHGLLLAGKSVLRMDHSTLADNAASGLMVGGAAIPTVTDSRLLRNATCGVCFTGGTAGSIATTILRDNGAGAFIAGAAAPVLRDNRISDSRVAGVSVQGTAHPRLDGNSVVGSAQLGIELRGTGAPRLIGNTVRNHAVVGILVDGSAALKPLLRGNILADNGTADVAFRGSSRGRAVGTRCHGSRVGILLDDHAGPSLSGNSCVVRDQR